jgi:hypothetical protein
MSDTGENWGRKGSMLGKLAIGFILFIILVIWIYGKNQDYLN